MSEIDRVAQEAAEKLKRLAVEAAADLDQAATDAETVRVASEEKRQTQEKDRRVAEGGLQNVPGEEDGRVEAETGRQEAETRRVQRDAKLLPRISLLVALPLALISLAPSLLLGYYLYDRQQSARNVSEDNREAIGNADDTIQQVRELTLTVSNALSARDESLADAIAQYCRENEVQDAILVSVLRSVEINLKAQLPPTLLQDLRDAIVALEPKGEAPCPLRPGIQP